MWSWRFPCIASCLPIVWTHPHPAPSVLAHRSRHPIPILGHATTTHPVFPYCGCCCFSRSCSASTLTPHWLRQHGQEETPHAPECSLCILVLQCAIPGVPGLGPRGRVSSCALAIVGVATEDARKEIHGCVIRWGDVCAADIHLGNRGRRSACTCAPSGSSSTGNGKDAQFAEAWDPGRHNPASQLARSSSREKVASGCPRRDLQGVGMGASAPRLQSQSRHAATWPIASILALATCCVLGGGSALSRS